MIEGAPVFFLRCGVLTVFLTVIQGQEQQQCGKLRETQFYNHKLFTDPDEHTWIGRLFNGGEPDKPEPVSDCLAVLIHQRYAILTALCTLYNYPSTLPKYIVFGDWRANPNTKTGDCRVASEITQCSPSPQAVDIEEFAVHPLYVKGKLDNDIALAKLVRNVELSEFVQPLCLPPAQEIEGNYIGQRLEIAGFQYQPSNREEVTEELEWRIKATRHASSLEYCTSVMEPLIKENLSQSILCVVGVKTNYLQPGSPLMDFELMDGKPRNYYLVGIKTFGTLGRFRSWTFIDGYLRILPFRNWILRNIE
ncbi:phenoloxidase-activating factor 3-like [Drosophila kikkawai]|uniref:Phenoloxidase-activating factor 3-like n=1 Tax=Drosophila kikkawai TaxID=30033 RepID=A0ABM4GND4_DROKI